MEHKEIAEKLVKYLGGKGNIVSATHCATRLRLVIEDENEIDQNKIEEIDEVKGAFSSSGQYQIIFGTGLVNKVFQEFAPLVDLSGEDHHDKPSNHQDAIKKKMNPFARFARTLSNIFVPIIPAIVAAGMLMGLLGLMNTYNWLDSESGLFIMLDMFSSASFIILPILIGFSAAKEFGANPFLGAVIGGIMTHPDLLNPWGLSDVQPETLDFFGFGVEMLGYQGTVIPVLLTVFVMAKLEKLFRKFVPNVIDLLVTPFLTVIFTGFFALLVIGPLGRLLGEGITNTLDFVYATAGPVAGFLFGGLYSIIVLTGVHHSFHAIEAELLVSVGANYLLPIWAMSNVAQGGATLAVFLKTKIKNKGYRFTSSCFLVFRNYGAGHFWCELKISPTIYRGGYWWSNRRSLCCSSTSDGERNWLNGNSNVRDCSKSIPLFNRLFTSSSRSICCYSITRLERRI
ncbi:PTS system transporter subunit IIC [Bacillus sp. TS-2]|nr:PTS system transporter subunit IIC [Bacillus sp. TS-2]